MNTNKPSRWMPVRNNMEKTITNEVKAVKKRKRIKKIPLIPYCPYCSYFKPCGKCEAEYKLITE